MVRTVSLGARLGELSSDRDAVVLRRSTGTIERCSYRDLDLQSNRLARRLGEWSVGPESRIAVAVPNSIEWFVVCFAIWKLGGCVFTIRDDLPTWELDRLFNAAQPTHVIGDIGGDALPAIPLADLSRLDHFDPGPLPDRIPHPYKVNATGGSTGMPKIVVPSEPGVVTIGASAAGEALRLSSGQVQLVAGPLYHYGPSRNAIGGVIDGHTIVIFDRFDPRQTMEAIEHHRVQIGMLVPTMLYRILELPNIGDYDTTSLVRLTIAGAKCPDWVFEKAIDIFGPDALWVGYGGTENVGVTSATAAEWLLHRGTAGRPIFTDIRIQAPDGSALPPGEIGEIWMRPHAGLSTSYLGQDLSRTVDGFASLGDIGWLDADEYLYIADRRTDLIVSGGSNIYPAEVEAALLQHPAVADAAVVGKADFEWGAHVHAVLVASKEPVPPDSIRAFCAGLLAPYKVPRSIEWRAALPRDDLGKLRRSAL